MATRTAPGDRASTGSTCCSTRATRQPARHPPRARRRAPSPTPSTTPPAESDLVSLWDARTPTSAEVDPDTRGVELGTYFTAEVDGWAHGASFWKSPENVGPHVANLWDDDGALLATAAFTTETASGWQHVDFSEPVALTAGKSYTVSYFAPNGRYQQTVDFTQPSSTSALSVPARDAGVYSYGSSSSFPERTWRSSQYWVDVTFEPAGASPTPSATPTPTATPTPADSHAFVQRDDDTDASSHGHADPAPDVDADTAAELGFRPRLRSTSERLRVPGCEQHGRDQRVGPAPGPRGSHLRAGLDVLQRRDLRER